MSKIDLHNHSEYSLDGQYEVQYLMEQAKKANLEVFAIADHNSVKGARIANTIKEQYDFTFVNGIEIDCTYKGIELHLLGYDIDVNESIFDEIENDIITQTKNNSKTYVDKISELGIHVDIDILNEKFPDGIFVAEDIAEIVLADSRNDNVEVLLPYRTGGNRSNAPFVNFYWDLCAQGKPAYAPMKFMTIEDAISIIKKCNGISVIAHPAINFDGHDDYVEELLMNHVDGIEVYSSYHNKEQTQKYLGLAQKHNKLVTVGSDFHGKTKPHITIGMIEVEQEDVIIKQFINALKN